MNARFEAEHNATKISPGQERIMSGAGFDAAAVHRRPNAKAKTTARIKLRLA
jgi:hypothetical protein